VALPDWEPLLPDDRVGKIADLLRIRYPDLRDAEFFSFVVPPQVVDDRRSMKHAPHERGCPFERGTVNDCVCGPLDIPEQAVFGIRQTPHPSRDPVYKGKALVTTEATWLKTWDAEARKRKHFVSALEDPAMEIYRIAAAAHVEKAEGYRQLI
jgi:hypothetical protein